MPREGHSLLDALSRDEVTQRVSRSLVATLSTQAARFFLQLCSTVLMARLLPPEDFGLIAMALVVTNFIGLNTKDAPTPSEQVSGPNMH